jgi:hypothetical protein
MTKKNKITFSEPCRICNASEWHILYEGPIRLGKFGEYSKVSHVELSLHQPPVGFYSPNTFEL